jgi:hypothetical protein
MIRHLPIVKPDEHVRNAIIIGVDKIIRALRESDAATDDFINQEKKKIDDFFFNLYSLTQREQVILRDF